MRFAVSILFQEFQPGKTHNYLRMGIIEASSHEEAIGKFLLFKRKEDMSVKFAHSAIELAIKIEDETPE